MTSDEMQVSLGYIIRWEPKFEIGIPVIDRQHKELFMLCNNLHMALNNKQLGGSWEDEFKYAIKECVEYVKVHFKSEEMLMQAAGFSGFKEHKEVHAIFIRKVLEFSSAENYSVGTAFQLVRFLYEWILSHIAHDDKLFVRSVLEYIKRRDANGAGVPLAGSA
ncbi:MAG: bacteriohemerythrin [Treponemataceae bacterium]|nr:bacteriohemerythrin [Treponemataceae bacterium]